MSYNTIFAAANDFALMNRTTACATQESYNNPTLSGTEFAAAVRQAPMVACPPLVWAVANEGEAAYASAVAAGNPNPGGDESVITDGQILAAVQANWPPDAPA